MNVIFSGLFWTALSAVGTIGAVIVALWQTLRSKSRKLSVSSTFSQYIDKKTLELVITLENIGGVPIIIKECGFGKFTVKEGNQKFLTDKNVKFIDKKLINVIDTTMNNYINDAKFPLLIKSGEAVLITYEYISEKSFEFDDEFITQQTEYKYFTEGIAVVKDSRNVIYLIK